MAKHTTDEQWIEVISNSLSYAEALRKLGLRPSGGNYTTLNERIKRLGIDTSHMTGQGWNQGDNFRSFHKEIQSSQIFCKNSYHNTGMVKRRLLKEGLKKPICENCGLSEWQGVEIPLEIHHIDGDKTNNTIENLQILCPNCHALTDNYRRKKSKTPR